MCSLICGMLVDEDEARTVEEEKALLGDELLVDTRYGEGPRRIEDERSVKTR